MRSLVILTFVLAGVAACGQTASLLPSIAPAPEALPDAPSAVLAQQQDVIALAEATRRANGDKIAPCSMTQAMREIHANPKVIGQVRLPCTELINPYQRFLDTNISIPLTPRQKGYLALHNLVDPASLLTIVGVSAFTIGVDSHTAYGPGWKGFGKNAGVSLLQDATGEFFGSFLIPSIAHQDPRYYRMPKASVPRRFLHAVSRTFVANNDDGSLMPNYATLLTYPISAEISNFYVPGIHSDAPSTVARIATGLATDPANNLIAEFLPDVARHINVRIIFVQRILNQVASEQPNAF
ncbi:MAG: hypothetical protein ABI380_11000 [Edaphobacter sp.]